MSLTRAEVEKVDLEPLRSYAASPDEFFGPKQHYKLLALLASRMPPERAIIDIGTHLGDSALALSLGGHVIESFDIIDKTQGRPHPSNVRYNRADLFDQETREKWSVVLLYSSLIVIDIDPHEGKRELELIEWLQANEYGGLIVLDDIWFFKQMRDNCWYRIESRHKTDVTSLGHWSGTGIVTFGKETLESGTSNWTLVTGYFDLTKKTDANDAIRARTAEHYIDDHGSSTLSLDKNLIVFCDSELEEKIWKMRPTWLHARTRVIPMSFEDFPLTKYREQIIKNRGGRSSCSADPRNTASYYLFCMARYAMLLQAIEKNSFESTHFAWINICIERMGFNNLIHLDEALSLNRDKFSTCWIDYVSKEVVEDLPRYFGAKGCAEECVASCTMCSGFFTGRADHMSSACMLIETQFMRALEAGFGHADEQLFPMAYYKAPALFDWYIGDYTEMITNYAGVYENPEAPLRNLIRNGDSEVRERACRILLESHRDGKCALDPETIYRIAAESTTRSHDRETALSEFIAYAKSAKELFGAEITEIAWAPPDGWKPINPSVCTDGDRRIVLLQTVNYTQTDWNIEIVGAATNLRTRNYVLEMSPDWRLIKWTQIKDVSGKLRNDDGFRAHGFEDCRLIRVADGTYFASASVRGLSSDVIYSDGEYGSAEMGILRFDGEWRINDVEIVRDYERHLLQKNWMPVSGQPYSWLYLCDPTVAITQTPGGTLEIARHESPACFSDLRGGSQLVEYENGWLCLTHEVAVKADQRVYLHRFIRLDRHFRIVSFSDPFYFERVHGVEFCAGLAWDGERLVASYGANNGGRSHLAFFNPGAVERQLGVHQ